MALASPFRPAQSVLEPVSQRRRIAQLYSALDPAQQRQAADLVAGLPRLIHSLAREGALIAPQIDEAR